MEMWTVKIEDQLAQTMQSDLNLHCSQKLCVSSTVRKELTLYHTILTFNEPEREAF